MNDAFFILHADLPREGPGDRASLDWAVQLAGTRRDARVMDAACGPGADIGGLLAHAPDGEVTAIEAHAPFVAQVKAMWGDDGRVTVRVGDMAKPGGCYDLIWCAGALYFLGVTEGLRAWRDVLRPGGAVAFSELVWLSDDLDPKLKAYMENEYPAVAGLATMEDRIKAAGYELLGKRVISDAAWEAYYQPMEERVARLRPGADPSLAAVLDEADEEIRLWRKHRRDFGYVLAVVKPR